MKIRNSLVPANLVSAVLLSLISISLQAQALPKPTIHVFVALADDQNQGIVPVPAGLGNGLDPDTTSIGATPRGGEPVGPKAQQSDHQTPEGLYVLDARSPNSHFYKAFHISYPNPKDIAAARRMGVSPGGDIMLHLDSRRSMHGWERRIFCTTGRTDAWP